MRVLDSSLCSHLFQRIAEIIKRKNKQRLAKAAALAKKEAAGDFSHLKNKKGELIAQPLPQPTLPNVRLDDDDDSASMRTRGGAPSVYTNAQSDYYYGDRKEYGLDYPQGDYPAMPGYNQPYAQHGGDPYNQFNPSVGTLPDEQPYDDNDYGSTAHLAMAAAPIAYPDHGNAVSPRPQYGYATQQQHDMFAYNNDHGAAAYRGPSPGPGQAYGDPHAAYRGASPGPGQAYTVDHAYDDGAQYGRQPVAGGQYQTHAQAAYAYPAHHDHGGGDGYDYGAGQAHAV